MAANVLPFHFLNIPTTTFTYIRFKTILYRGKVDVHEEVDSTAVSHDDHFASSISDEHI